MFSKIQTWWNSLPHAVQAAILLFAGAATGVIRKVIETPDACMSLVCWKAYVASAVHAGVVAVIALYIPANVAKIQGENLSK